jgi:hypothetical protein
VERGDGEADAKQAAAQRSEIAHKFNSGRRSRKIAELQGAGLPPASVVIKNVMG